MRKNLLGLKLKTKILTRLSILSDNLANALTNLEISISQMKSCSGTLDSANYCKDSILPDMKATREVVDKLESLVGKKYWTLPTYGDLLYSV